MSDAERYPIPAHEHRVEQIIERSRFITTIGPVATTEEAAVFVRRIGAEFSDATHNCWAYAVGKPGNTDRAGLSDDGEPHGTAGRPMLNALLHGGVGDVAVVVTRYYGGIKLGTGGLVRAYGGSVQQALATLPRAERIDYAQLTAIVGYPHIAALNALLPAFEATPLAEEYGAEVTFRVQLPAGNVVGFRAALVDATRGQGRFESDGTDS